MPQSEPANNPSALRLTTRVLLWSFAAALAVAVIRLAVRGHFGDGATLLIGSVLTAATLYGVLAIRTIASDGFNPRELDDFVATLSVTAWAFAAMPPRPSNFWPSGGADDFTVVYVPMSLIAVVAVRAASAVWSERSLPSLALRQGVVIALLLGVIAAATGWVSVGFDGRAYAARALVLAAAVSLVTLLGVFVWRLNAARR